MPYWDECNIGTKIIEPIGQPTPADPGNLNKGEQMNNLKVKLAVMRSDLINDSTVIEFQLVDMSQAPLTTCPVYISLDQMNTASQFSAELRAAADDIDKWVEQMLRSRTKQDEATQSLEAKDERIRELEDALEGILAYTTIETPQGVMDIINGTLNKENK